MTKKVKEYILKMKIAKTISISLKVIIQIDLNSNIIKVLTM